MFQRYTEKARRVVFFARYEASHYGSPEIEAEHLLLGLLREEKLVCYRWLPKAQPDMIRSRLEASVARGQPIPTSVDLPLSDCSERILSHAKDEADRLNSRHIGTEHLFLGLLQEPCPASNLLREFGADVTKLRVRFEPEAQSAQTVTASGSAFSHPAPSAAGPVLIHGLRWNANYIYDGVKRCRKYNWHWQKSAWKPRDIVLNRKTGKFSFDLALAATSADFELLKGGWKKDHCAICAWELFESEDHHGIGYTNGSQWVCEECYDKFWQRPDFIAGAYSDLT